MSKNFNYLLSIMVFIISGLTLCLYAMEDNPNQAGWACLADELKEHILSYLPGKNEKIRCLLDCKQVCKDWKRLINGCPLDQAKKYSSDAKNINRVIGKKKYRAIYDLFFVAAIDENFKITKALLESEIDLNSKDFKVALSLHSFYPLIKALDNRNEKLALLLINVGFDVNKKQEIFGCRTALHSAVKQGFYNIVEILVAKGANVNDRASDSLDYEIWKEIGPDEFTQVFYKPIFVAQNKESSVPLITASSFGYENIVKLLIAQGADVNLKDDLGRTALTVAANGRKKIVELLLKHGCTIDIRDNSGRTPLMWAAMLGHCKIVKHLLDSGADKQIKDRLDKTALSLAQENNQYECADLLIS